MDICRLKPLQISRVNSTNEDDKSPSRLSILMLIYVSTEMDLH